MNGPRVPLDAHPAATPDLTLRKLLVEIGQLTTWPPMEILKPWSSSSETFSTVPAFPSALNRHRKLTE
jgi:hypothetical protein